MNAGIVSTSASANAAQFLAPHVTTQARTKSPLVTKIIFNKSLHAKEILLLHFLGVYG